jgi:hypothetical protein
MTTQKRPSFTKVMTEPGVFVFPKLNSPDTKFKKDGEYGVKLRLSAEKSEALIEFYEAELKKYWPLAKAELQERLDNAKTGKQKAEAKKALEEMKEADKPYKPAYDDEGNETGEYEFNFKTPAQFESKKKDKDGNPVIVKLRPDIFDAKGVLLKNPPDIWGGTTGCVAGELRPFNMPIGIGLSLRLKAVQIIELRQGGGDRSASSYGFGKQEGYAADSEATAGGFEDRTSGEGAGAGSDGPDHEDF